jgi:Sulfotransferase family
MFKTILKQLGLRKAPIIHSNPQAIRIAVFISIPRNASKSVLDILALGPNRDVENTTSLVIYENHQRASVLKRRYDLSDLFLFCFIRNPYDRCVSWYEYHRNIEPYCTMSFESWVRKGLPHHVTVQNGTDYIAEGLSPLLQFNYVESQQIDFIGRIETFRNDMMIIVERLNKLCLQKQLQHRFKYIDYKTNTSNRVSNLEYYYSKETKEITYSLLQKDFTHFGYPK